MARLFTGDFEETFAAEGWTTAGTPTRVTTPVNSGGWSCEINSLGEEIVWTGTDVSELSWYVRLYLRLSALPASNYCRLLGIHISAGSELWRVSLNTSGQLQARTSAPANIGSPSSALSLNTWYVLETRTIRRAAGNDEREARVYQAGFSPGASFYVDSPFADIGWGAGPGRILISADEVAATFYVDDVAINDGSGATDNSWPGPLAAPPGQSNAPEKLRVVRSNVRVAS